MDKIAKISISILFAILLSISPNTMHAQNIIKFEKTGDRYFWQENFEEALEAYQKVLELDPTNALALYRSEICSLLTYYPTKPLNDLYDYSKIGGQGDRFYDYWLGRINLKKQSFKESCNHLVEFLEQEGYKSPEIIAETKEFIQVAKLAHRFYRQNEQPIYVVEQLDDHVNTEMDELSPVVCSDNNLIFLSSKKENEINHKKEIFQVYNTVKEEGTWALPSVEKIFGEFEFHNESLSSYGGGGKIVYTKSNDKDDLKLTIKTGDTWSEGAVFDETLIKLGITGRYCLSNDGNTLIFSSDKINSRTDLDLYEIKRGEDGHWGEPVNLGGFINTSLDEDSPYLSLDGTRLYFSSRGHGSIGGYDVFYAKYSQEENRWLSAVQMEYPINTINDDIHFVLDNENGGYLASDRYGTKGGFDLFYFSTVTQTMANNYAGNE